MLTLDQSGEAVDSRFGNHQDTAAIAAIPTIGAAPWDIFFTAKTDAAIPPFASLDIDSHPPTGTTITVQAHTTAARVGQ